MSAPDATRLGRASPLIKARVRTRDPAREMGFVERTALFLVALKKENALGLLDGFGEASRERARLFAQQVSDLDSSTRQARLALEFGVRDGVRDRVGHLLADSPPALRAALASLLPASLRPRDVRPPAETPSPALQALAARLIREASR